MLIEIVQSNKLYNECYDRVSIVAIDTMAGCLFREVLPFCVMVLTLSWYQQLSIKHPLIVVLYDTASSLSFLLRQP